MYLFRKNSLVFLLLLAASLAVVANAGCSKAPGRNVTFKVISKYPLQTSDTVFLTGNHETLGTWNPAAVSLIKQPDSSWTKTLSFNEGERLEFKFTLGSWPFEALTGGGWIPKNSKLTVAKDTTVTIIIDKWLKYFTGEKVLRSAELQGDETSIVLLFWKCRGGDNPEWAKPQFNDSLWKSAESGYLGDSSGWKGVGWFRTHLYVDSSLWNKTIGINIQHLGAADIYCNGRLIKSAAKSTTSHWGFASALKNKWGEFTFDNKTDQLIAVRYENYDAESQTRQGYVAGFFILLMGLDKAFSTADAIWSYRLFQMVFTIIPLVLSFMHLCLFFFYRRQRQNLYYAICLLGFAGLTYFNFESILQYNVYMLVLYERLVLVFPQTPNILSASTAIFFGTLTLLSISYGKLPKRWLLYLVLYIAVCTAGFLNISWPMSIYSIYLQFGIMLAEGLLAGFRRKRIKRKGTWIILTGFLALSIFIILQLMMDYGLIYLQGMQLVYVYGMLAFAMSMSLYLSYNFAFVNKDLEQQLVKVKDLSDKAIEHERIQASLEVERRVMEVERRAMEADDLRKTKELESARDLQLSLLPKQVPQLGNLEIACYMKTAAEVGGDYYDFHLSEDGTLTAVIGDATGHGLKAGNMVILAKGLFNTLAMEDDLLEIIHSFNHSIKQMNLYMLTMCMSLIRIKDSTLEYVSAGMPPMQIYRKEKKEVEELLLKGMPLGAFNDFPYKKISASLCHGDVILIMSDGLHEMFNAQKETYGMERVVETFRESADRLPQEIIDYICSQSRDWAGDAPLEDDMTIMVIRVK